MPAIGTLPHPYGDAALWAATGRLPGIKAVNKFGRSVNVDSAAATDLHDGSATNIIWDAPTVARNHTVVSADALDVSGAGTLTLTGQPADTQTVTIGAKVYTFQTVLTNIDGNVKIGASASATIDNLVAAINLAAGAGTTYATAMTANAISTTAAVGAGDTMTLYDNTSAAIATTDTADNTAWGAPNTVNGTGARTVRIYGLTSWGAAEVSEDIILHGVDGVATVNDYVIIHRMEVLTSGGTLVNTGIIKATAETDASITAQILAQQGQTQMAIYGIPSTQTAYISGYYVSIIKAAAACRVKASLLVNPEPDSQLTAFTIKHNIGLDTTATNYLRHDFNPYLKIAGPAIIKVQGDASAADTDVIGGFDLVLLDNS
jgi:hypothetical protein